MLMSLPLRTYLQTSRVFLASELSLVALLGCLNTVIRMFKSPLPERSLLLWMLKTTLCMSASRWPEEISPLLWNFLPCEGRILVPQIAQSAHLSQAYLISYGVSPKPLLVFTASLLTFFQLFPAR